MGLDDNIFHFQLEETLFVRKELRELGGQRLALLKSPKKKN